ncbi:Apocytochrome f precursor (fragment) [Candidatus Methylomirabilis oxygeniifera]|uniref:Apocytochrome f n=1 Tax=Methylomirabilis oxygeniifera TaxID=671143 RepID=D5MN54_METO1
MAAFPGSVVELMAPTASFLYSPDDLKLIDSDLTFLPGQG